MTSSPEISFYGHGKLLITGEYFVLDGAQALALPTRFGQHMRVRQLHASENILYWVALNNKKQAWLNLVFDTTDFSCINSTIDEAKRLTKVLQAARELNPKFLMDGKDCAVETRLEFPNEWGLGTSSTLIYTVSEWAGVDAYTLLQKTLGGSGYDIACAANNTAILYKLQNGKPETLPVNWQPPFTSTLYFAYTGKKQLSSEGIKYYREKLQEKQHAINQLTDITQRMLHCETLNRFEELLNEHENIVGSNLKLMKVKDTLFADYWGCVKSLGAWGGDFVLLTNRQSEDDLKEYLKTKNIPVVFNWNKIIL